MRILFLFVLLLTLATGHAEVPIPGQPQHEAVVTPPSYEHALGKMLLTLFGLIILILLTVWIMRRLSAGRLGRTNTDHAIKILEKRALSPKSMLYLLEVEGKHVLISESQLEVRALSTEKKTVIDEQRN